MKPKTRLATTLPALPPMALIPPIIFLKVLPAAIFIAAEPVHPSRTNSFHGDTESAILVLRRMFKNFWGGAGVNPKRLVCVKELFVSR